MTHATPWLRAAACLLALAVTDAGPVQAAPFDAAGVYQTASPSVVLVFAHRGRSTGNAGTGTIIDGEGLILTNRHVIRDLETDAPYRTIRVYLKPETITGDRNRDLGRGHWAHVVAEDAALDLALLRIQGDPGPLPVARFADSERVVIGQSVAAIGHPSGGGLWTLTTGAISSMRKDGQRDVFQTDTAINPGNSGGPLLDAQGHMVGVNTFIRRRSATNLPLEGLNYALRSTEVADWVRRQGFEVQTGMTRMAAVPAKPAVPQASPEMAPMPSAPAAPAPPEARPQPSAPADRAQGQKAPRRFRGANGETMFGVPDPTLDLEDLRRQSWEKTRRNAEDAFHELGDDDFDVF